MHVRIATWCVLAAMGAGVVIGLVGPADAAAAQESHSVAGVVPDMALCRAAPRTVDELIALFDGVAVEEPVPAAQVGVPTGRPGSAALIESVTATITEAVACLNAGDFLRFLSLLTDHAIVTAFSWMGAELLTSGAPPELVNPTPVTADMRQSIVAVADVRSLDHDRVGAFLVIADPASGQSGLTVIHLTFVHNGVDWLIDEVVDFSSE